MKQKTIRMQTRRLQITSGKWHEVSAGNSARKYLRVAIGAGNVLPTNPGVVQVAFDTPGENYLLVWALRPFEPHVAPGNKVLLRAQKNAPGDPDVTVMIEVTEGLEVEL